VTGLELVGGFLVAWAVRKARRVGARVDELFDQVLDAGLDRLGEVVAGRLGDDPALVKLEQEAAAGDVQDRTRARVQLAVEQAVDDDAGFAGALAPVLAELTAHPEAAVVLASGTRAVAVGGDLHAQADRGSAAAGTMGDVTVGSPPDPSRPGRLPG